MYVPQHAREERPEVLFDAIDRIGFGALATARGERIELTHVPMLALRESPPRVIGHLARANPQWRDASGVHALASFLGPHFYVSPNDYAAIDTTGEVVPTWNYIIVEARGPITFFEDAARSREIVARLTKVHEASQVRPWRMHDAPPEYIESELAGIVGFEMRVNAMIGAWKLSRNHDAADRERVSSRMETSDDPAVRALAQAVRGAAR